jgi:hypothetical protein
MTVSLGTVNEGRMCSDVMHPGVPAWSYQLHKFYLGDVIIVCVKFKESPELDVTERKVNQLGKPNT